MTCTRTNTGAAAPVALVFGLATLLSGVGCGDSGSETTATATATQTTTVTGTTAPTTAGPTTTTTTTLTTGSGSSSSATSGSTTTGSTGSSGSSSSTTTTTTTSDSDSDSGTGGMCAAENESCTRARCCEGLTCCFGRPLPPGEEYCAAQGMCPMSDRNLKRDFRAIDPAAVLAAVAGLPITTWSYKDDGSRARHIGPMAQDFQAAFSVGQSDRFIFQVDADGVALAAIQALHGEVRAREVESVRLRGSIEAIERRLDRLEGRASDRASAGTRTSRVADSSSR